MESFHCIEHIHCSSANRHQTNDECPGNKYCLDRNGLLIKGLVEDNAYEQVKNRERKIQKQLQKNTAPRLMTTAFS